MMPTQTKRTDTFSAAGKSPTIKHAAKTPGTLCTGRRAVALALVALLPSMPLYAQSALEGMGREIIETVVYSLIGILMAVIGFKVVDWLTPGNLAEDVAHKENRALAILAGSMILGVCMIIASALID